MSTTEARLRRESLRRQIALLEHVKEIFEPIENQPPERSDE